MPLAFKFLAEARNPSLFLCEIALAALPSFLVLFLFEDLPRKHGPCCYFSQEGSFFWPRIALGQRGRAL